MEENEKPAMRQISEAEYQELLKVLKDNEALYTKLDETKMQLAAYRVNFELIVFCVLGMTGVFGLNNESTGMIREEILTGEESPMSAIMKELTGLMTDVTLAKFNKAKEKQLQEKFSFFRYLPAVSTFYDWQAKNLRVNVPDELLVQLPQSVIDNLKKQSNVS